MMLNKKTLFMIMMLGGINVYCPPKAHAQPLLQGDADAAAAALAIAANKVQAVVDHGYVVDVETYNRALYEKNRSELNANMKILLPEKYCYSKLGLSHALLSASILLLAAYNILSIYGEHEVRPGKNANMSPLTQGGLWCLVSSTMSFAISHVILKLVDNVCKTTVQQISDNMCDGRFSLNQRNDILNDIYTYLTQAKDKFTQFQVGIHNEAVLSPSFVGLGFGAVMIILGNVIIAINDSSNMPSMTGVAVAGTGYVLVSVSMLFDCFSTYMYKTLQILSNFPPSVVV